MVCAFGSGYGMARMLGSNAGRGCSLCDIRCAICVSRGFPAPASAGVARSCRGVGLAPDMPPRKKRPRPAPPAALQRYGLLLVPDFSLIALASVVDPLRLANMTLGRKVYEWLVLGTGLDAVASSDGIRVLPDRSIADGERFDAVFVIGPNPIPRRGYGEVSSWLRRQAARGTALGGVDTGSVYLARAGLLDGYRCTIHWEDRDALLEQFPQLIVSNHLFEIDRDRYTCSGGVSPLDMMTFLLSQPPGSRELAEQVSDLLVAQRRSHDEHQTVPLRHRLGQAPKPLVDAL